MTDCALSQRHIMRIVASCARQSAGRFLKAGRFAQAITLLSYFELVVISGSRLMVEMQDVTGQWLTRTVREDSTVVSRDGIRKAEAGRFEMALQTNFQSSFGVQARRVHD